MGKINLLPASVAELIAAGEVIDRPASIVKELVENALDAGATRITVELKNGGITYLRVTDNGCGIGQDELALAFVRHATSKVSTAEDLEAIMTLGFRGEALPSIAAVSRVCVTTRTADNTLGCRFTLSAGVEGELEDAGCAVGTTFEVRDVFYNTPARMKFLKKDVVEGNAVASLLDRLALANPSVSFELLRDGKRVLQTPGDGALRTVIRLVCGADVAAAMIPVGFSQDGVTIEGMISKPSVARSTRSLQTFFINSRYIRSRTCAGAVEEAYKNRLMTGRFPGCVLNLRLDSALVDVNVHPSKLEVRFSSERTVYNAVYSACLAALTGGEVQTSGVRRPVTAFDLVNFDHSDRQMSLPVAAAPPAREGVRGGLLTLRDGTDRVFSPALFPGQGSGDGEAAGEPVDKTGAYTESFSIGEKSPTYGRHVSIDIECDEEPHEHRENRTVKQNNITDSFSEKSPISPVAPLAVQSLSPFLGAPASLPPRIEAASGDGEPAREMQGGAAQWMPEKIVPYRVLGELFDTYVIVEQSDELLLIDKHAAHERSIYNQIRHLGEGGERQLLLAPSAVTLPRDEYFALLENPGALDALGIVAEDFGEGALLVREVPLLLLSLPLEDLLLEAARGLLTCKASLTPSALDELLYSVSCKAALKAGSASGAQELDRIAEMVLGDETIRFCPHGRPVLLRLSKKEIGRMFGRLG